MDLKTALGGNMSKKKAPKSAFHGPADSSFTQKKKVVLGNVKYSGDKKDISLSKSGLSDSVYSDLDSLSGNNEDVGMSGVNGRSLLGLAATTPKVKHVNTSTMFGSPLGSPDFTMDDDEIVLLPCLSISLEKKWIDPNIIKTPIEVLVKKFFALDINLLAVEEKSATAKTQVIRKLFFSVNGFGGATILSKFEEIIQSTFISEQSIEMAVSLARKKGIDVNSDLKRQKMRSDQAVIIKEILMDTPKDMIIVTVSKFGKIKSIKIQLIGMWQKAMVEFAKLDQANLLAFKWFFLIGKDSVHVAKATGGKTCVINRSLETSNRIRCAVVGFEFNNDLESAFCTEPILGGIKLSWVRMDLVWCEKYRKFGHSALECDAPVASPFRPSRIFKRVAPDECHLQLAKLYEKKDVLISWPTAFVVSLAGFSGGSHFSNGSSTSPPFFGVSDSINDSPLILADNSFLNACLNILECSLELLMDQMSNILKKLNGMELVPMVTSSSVFPPANPTLLVLCLDVDMVLDNMILASTSPPLAVDDIVHDSSSSFSKVLTSKVGELESKMVAFEVLIGSVLERLDRLCSGAGSLIATCNVKGINNPAKQDDIIHWHKNMNNLISIFTKTKLRDRVCSWIINKFNGVRVFTSGLNSGHLGSGVAIIMDNSLARYVCKVSEVSGRLFSIRLLFNNKLSVTILGLYAGTSLDVQFSQAGNINLLIARAVNKSSFIVLGGDFNENSLCKSASFKKCLDLSLVNSLGVSKTIDYIFVSYNLVSTVINHGVADIGDHFDFDHRAVSVHVGLDRLLDVHLNSIHKQANKDYWKYDIKVNAAMFSEEFASSVVSFNLDSMWDTVHKIMVFSANDSFKKKWFKSFDSVFTKGSSRFHRLEILNSVRFISLMSHWASLDSGKVLAIQVLLDFGANFDCVRSALFGVSAINRHMEGFASDKGHIIRSILEHSFHKVELDHLVVGDKLILEPELVKAKVDVIMEEWTRRHKVVFDVSSKWFGQYQPLEYVFDSAFLDVIWPVDFNKLFGVISDLLDDKAAGFSSILNKFWKHCDKSIIGMLLELLNTCLIIEFVPSFWKEAWILMIPKPYEWEKVLINTYPIALIETAHKILFKILSNRIFLAYSRFNDTSTQLPIFAVGLVIKDALEKNHELWLVL
ncbi:hypothetical protein G9A89_022774 [Geosiphon pyriformis]|nr:hypothetical protein G9A89_022774 [Geosiphon pyriformis]